MREYDFEYRNQPKAGRPRAGKSKFFFWTIVFVGILGIVLVLAFFQASGAVSIPDTGNSSITGIDLIDDFINALLGR